MTTKKAQSTPPQDSEPVTGQTVPPFPPLHLEVSWWGTTAAGWPDQELIGCLDQPQSQRHAELDRLHAELEQLPPWDDVHRAAASFTVHMNGLYSQASSWLEGLAGDAAWLEGLDDRQHAAALKHRDEQRGQPLAIEA